MTTAIRKPPNHDTLTCYTEYRCRRPECVERHNTWRRNRYHAQAAGTWQPHTDAEPIRQHLRTLYTAGVSIHRVAAITGIDYQTIRCFTHHAYRNRHGRRRGATPEIAAKILAVSVENANPPKTDATATRRRLQALIALGWPLERIAPHAGLSAENISAVVRRRYVMATTARAVEDTYNRLRNQKPARHGVDKASITKARKRAAANRWPTPKYWDQAGPDAIGDADFVPDYGVTRAEIVAEEAHWLITTAGLTRAAAAERLGIARCYVDRALSEHPQDDEAAA